MRIKNKLKLTVTLVIMLITAGFASMNGLADTGVSGVEDQSIPKGTSVVEAPPVASPYLVGDTITDVTSGLKFEVLSEGGATGTVEVMRGSYTGTSYSIPDTITHNGITYTVTSIGYGAFYKCSTLTSIDIPGSVTSIGDGAFSYCHSLTSINIPSSVTSIGNQAFRECTSLTSIDIPDSVTSIGDWAFQGCRTLASINIPDSVTSIGYGTFEYCSSLISINIPDSVTSIGDYAFLDCHSLASINIPDSVTSIGNMTFAHCRSLASVTIPDSVTSIGDAAFYGCSTLASVVFASERPPSFGTTPFAGISSPIVVFIPKGAAVAYAGMLTILPVGSSVSEYTPMKISSAGLPNGQIGLLYKEFVQTNAQGATFSIVSGSLPSGLALNATTGEISGTPTATASFTFSIKAEAVYGADVKSFTIVIDKAPVYPMAQIPSAANDYTAIVEVDFADFVGVSVDGKALTAADFTARSGSTILQLSKTYVASLSDGSHTIVLSFAGGTATATFVTTATGGTSTGTGTTSSSSGSSGMASTYKSVPVSPADANYNPTTGGGKMISTGAIFLAFSLVSAVIMAKKRR